MPYQNTNPIDCKARKHNYKKTRVHPHEFLDNSSAPTEGVLLGHNGALGVRRSSVRTNHTDSRSTLTAMTSGGDESQSISSSLGTGTQRTQRSTVRSNNNGYIFSTQSISAREASMRLCLFHPRRIYYTVLNFPIHSKLFCMLLGPVLTLIFLLIVLSYTAFSQIAVSGSILGQVDTFTVIADLSYSLAKERDLALTLASSSKQDDIRRLTALHATASQQAVAVEYELEPILDLSESSQLKCHNQIMGMDTLRRQVENQTIHKQVAFNQYTEAILQCLQVINTITFTTDHNMPPKIFSLRFLLEYLEHEGRVRAHVSSALAQENVSLAAVNEIQALQSESLLIAHEFIDTHPHEREHYEEMILESETSLLQKNVVDSFLVNRTSSVQPVEFFQAMEKQIDLVRVLEKDLVSTVHVEALNTYVLYITGSVVIFLVVLFTIFLSLLLTITCAGCIYYPWKVMLRKSAETADFTASLVNALSTLDFGQKQIVKLAHKPTPRCTPLEENLKTIVRNMQLMSSYLPQTMVQQMKNPSTIIVDASRRKSSVVSLSRRRNSSLMGSVHDSEGQTQKTEGMSQLSFSCRDVCICIMDMRDFHEIFRLHSSADVHLIYTQIIDTFFPIIQQHRGVAELQGDKLIVSWNNATRVVDKEVQAVTCAWKCHQKLTTVLSPMWKKSALPCIQIRMSIVSGEVWTGGVGTEGFHNFVSIAPTVSRVWKYNEMFKQDAYFDSVCSCPILLDRKSAEAVKFHFSCRQIDYSVINTCDGAEKIKGSVLEDSDEGSFHSESEMGGPEAVFTIWDALQGGAKDGNQKKDSDEWLYEISSVLERKVPAHEEALQKAWESLSTGDSDKAEAFLHSCRELSEGQEGLVNCEILKRLESLIDASL